MNAPSQVKTGIVDLAAVFFIIGGVISLIMTMLTIPIASLYPFTFPTNFTTSFLIVLAIGLICSLGALHCASLATKRMLSEAGMRGVVFGALLLILSLGLIGSITQPTSNTSMFSMTVSSILVLIAGAICFALRHTTVSASSVTHPQLIPQPTSR